MSREDSPQPSIPFDTDALALVERQARAWENADIPAALADFAPDGVLISPGGRWQGHAAIAQALADFWKTVLSVRVTVTRAFLAGDLGAAEWTWEETRLDGSLHRAEDGIVFVLAAGKIVYWREYFDTANF